MVEASTKFALARLPESRHTMSSISIIGLGNMARALAARALAGGNAVEVFQVGSGAPATLSGLTIADGSAAIGGGARHAIKALTEENATEAVTRPALAAGRSFTEGAISRLLHDLRDERGRIQPSLLQVVCRQLWEDLPASVHEVSEQIIGEFSDPDTANSAVRNNILLPSLQSSWLLLAAHRSLDYRPLPLSVPSTEWI